jgi:hypothetical protein
MRKRITIWLSGTLGAAAFLSVAQPLGWCLIICTATACLLLLVYVFGPDKQSDRIARLLRLPRPDNHRREIRIPFKKG